MIVYLTFGDGPSGVYWGQVTDVIAHLRTLTSEPIRLVSMVSARVFSEARRQIRERSDGAIVLPHVPSVRRWRYNLPSLVSTCLGIRPGGLIARGAMATDLALSLRRMGLVRRICFDARGAYAAEASEYLMPDDRWMIAACERIEQRAVHEADFRLAVSGALVEYWRERYLYAGNDHVVIPCAMSHSSERHVDEGTRPQRSGVRIVFSGSVSGWQSLDSVGERLECLLSTQPNATLLFLCRPDPHCEALARRYPGQVEIRFVPAHDVPRELASCDVGVMLREDSLTNRVASPVKFAEYLSAGLKVLISEHLGDFSSAERDHGLGWVVAPGAPLPRMDPTTAVERDHVREYAAKHLVKSAHNDAYRRLLAAIS